MLGVGAGAIRGRRAATAGLLAVLFSVAVAVGLDRLSPVPSADVRRGSEGAFASGLEPREIEGGIVRRRWSGETLTARFARLPEGPLRLGLVVRGHQHDVLVTAGGVVVGALPRGRSRGEFDVVAGPDGRLSVTLSTQAFEARGRRLGFMLERLIVHHGRPRGLPPASMVVLFAGPALLTLGLAIRAGFSMGAAGALIVATTLALAALLWPEGLVRSPYAGRLALLLGLGTLVAAWGAHDRSAEPRATRFGFPALLLALWVQLLLVVHPMLVTSDAVFHANKVRTAAQGQYFPVSLTPHDPPYVFPYGVSFHLLLAPLHRAGLDPEGMVRGAAAIAAFVASVALLRTLRKEGAGRAAAAVGLLQILPVTFGPLSAGNYSNVFAQALTLLFLIWDERKHPGGWSLGAGLLLFASTAHFGGFLVLLVLVPVLLWVRRAPRPERKLWAAALLGLGGAVLYYLKFIGVLISQLSRLAEQGAGHRDVLAAVVLQGRTLLNEWGWPVVLAAAIAAAARLVRTQPPFARALWLSAGLLALVATLTPLEVRYLYAAAPAAALLAADGLAWLRHRKHLGLLVGLLVLAQSALALGDIAQGLLRAYRP